MREDCKNTTNMPRLSYWEQQTFFSNIDVIVIGSGIVGLSTAIHLKEAQPNLKVVILERGPLPIGASTRNAGFACFGSMTELIDDLENISYDEVFSTVEKRWKGLLSLRSKLSDKQLDYHQLGGYEVFSEKDVDRYELCLDRMTEFNQTLSNIIGAKDIFQQRDSETDSLGLGKTKHLILNTQEGQLNTGKMMKGLLQIAQDVGVKIYNGIEIKNWESTNNEVILETAAGWIIRCKQLVVATNAFANKLFPDLEVTPARNQVMITNPINNLKCKGCFHYDQGYVYFRNVGNRILIGGARNTDPENSKTSLFGGNEKIETILTEQLKKMVLPNQPFTIDQKWSGIIGIGKSKTPIIQQYKSNIVVAVRLGGMGVAIGYGVGAEAAKLVV